MRRRRPEGDGHDGVRVTARTRRRRWPVALVALLALVAVGGWWLGRGNDAPDSVERAGPAGAGASAAARGGGSIDAPAGAVAGPAAGGPGRVAAVGVADGVDPTPDLSDYVLPGEAPEMGQVIEALHARGIRTGLGAFSPPGTSPPLQGIEVPAGFPLPDGYVRHHQVTDDGQPIAPILMFAPDRDTVVVNGVRVAVPPDRVVPPGLVPPGMPVRRVVIPPPDAGGGP